MEIKARKRNGIIVLDLAGRIDVDSANFIEVAGQCIRDGYNDFLCNFEEVDFIDYLGVSAIVLAYKEVGNSSGRMKFVNIPAHLRGVFSISGLDRVIEIYASEDLAVNSFKEDKIIEKIKRMQLRRRFKRVPIDIKVEIRSKYEKVPACYKVEILNLSAVGAFIFGGDKFKLGDAVVLKIKLPPKDEELELDARVVWLPDRQIQPHFHPGMGLEFYNISSQVQQKIIEFINRNLSLLSTDQG
jgi:anti-anti-sigma factor